LNYDKYVQKALVHTCPLSISPSRTLDEVGIKTVTDTGEKVYINNVYNS